MASMYLYSIKDIVAKEFGPIFQAKNDQVAVRQVNNTFKTMPRAMRKSTIFIDWASLIRKPALFYVRTIFSPLSGISQQ